MSLLIPGSVPLHHCRCYYGGIDCRIPRGTAFAEILRKIRNNFFIAVGLGNCMGFGQLFNKIISGSVPLHHCRCDCGGIDCRIPRGGSSEQSSLYSVFLTEKHSSASLLLLFPENVGYNPPLFGSPVLTAQSYEKSEIIFSLQLGVATVWASGNYSIKLFRGTFRSIIAVATMVVTVFFCPEAARRSKVRFTQFF